MEAHALVRKKLKKTKSLYASWLIVTEYDEEMGERLYHHRDKQLLKLNIHLHGENGKEVYSCLGCDCANKPREHERALVTVGAPDYDGKCGGFYARSPRK